jgi:hypothetical protein
MRKYKKILKDVTSDIVCDICGKSCVDERWGGVDAAEFATLEAIWGYCSKKDGEKYGCEMCEDCFDKVKSYIDTIKQP